MPDNIYYQELEKHLAQLGIELLIQSIPKIIDNQIKPKTQDESKATYTKIIKKQDGKIDWNISAIEIERQIRAFQSWPKSFCFWNDKRVNIIKAKALKSKQDFPIAKTSLSDTKELLVQSKNSYLIIEELQVQGKKPTNSQDFLRGNPKFINTILK